jgi:S1-C subfamily serine protease
MLTAAVDARPASTAEMERLEWPELELTVRAASAEDRRAAGLAPEANAVTIAQVESAGWAELAGLATGDILLTINGHPVSTVSEVGAIRQALPTAGEVGKVTITVQRGRYRTVLAEIETLP